MLCPKCKKDMPPDAVFCCFCGKKIQPSTRTPKKRGNGQGTVFKLNGKWAAEVTLGYISDNGQLRRRSRRKQGFETKKAALAYLQELSSNTVRKKSVTVSELYSLYLDVQTLSESKLQAYNIAYNKIKNKVAYRQIDSFTVPELQELVDTSAPSYYTRRDIKQLLSHLYELALRDDLTDKNKAQFIKLPQHQTAERLTFTPEEIDALWNDYRKSQEPVTAAALIMLYTGMRTGEVEQLQAENLHLDEHYLTGGIKTKKSKARKIIVPDIILPILQALPSEGRLFPFGKKYMPEAWQRKRRDLNFRPDLTLYCCRHTFVTRLTALNVSPAMLQELVGHTDYDTTLNYTHLSIADRLQAVNQL